MIVAFGLLWIPYLSDVGGLLALIGVIFLFLGRRGFDKSHRWWVIAGGACVVTAILLILGVTVWFLGSIVTVASQQNGSVQAVGAQLQSGLGVLFAVGLFSGALVSFGYLALPYGLSDRASRLMMWGAFALTVTISILVFLTLHPLIDSAIVQSTSGSTINTGPVHALDNRSAFLQTAQVFPDLIFLWAYYRTRSRIFNPAPPGGGAEGPNSKMGRTIPDGANVPKSPVS